MAAKRTPRRKPASTRRTTARRTTARRFKPQDVTPYLTIDGAAEAIEWYKKAFGAKELDRQLLPSGQVMHAALTIGKSQVFLSDAFPGGDTAPPTQVGGTSVTLHLFARDVDKVWQRAVQAGAKVTMPLDDMFWGDRYGKLTDPFGHAWSLGAKSKLGKAELERKREEAMRYFASMAEGRPPG